MCYKASYWFLGSHSRRFVHNKTLFRILVDSAKGLPPNSTFYAVGGNAPVMANRLAHEGFEVLLAAKMNPEQAQTLHHAVHLLADVKSNNQHGDDIHLILEYGTGDRWGDYCSPRANRFIVHSDYSNMMLEALDGFAVAIQDFSPHLLIVSGLQMLDNFPYDINIRAKKLVELKNLLVSQPRSLKIHFEMASFTDEALLHDLYQYVLPYSDSLGMNEQELDNLHNLVVYGNISYASDFNPRVANTLDLMRSLHKALRKRQKPHHRTLTRIHVHTLAYQVVMTTQGPLWRNTRAAAAKASLMANRHVCNSSIINTEHARLIMDESFSVSQEPTSERVPLIEEAPVSCWIEENHKICVAPNLVCTTVLKTAGAGDNISAAGLSLQI